MCLGPNSRAAAQLVDTHTHNTPPPPPSGTRQHDAEQHLRDRDCQAHSRLSVSSEAAAALPLSLHPALCRRIHDDSLRPLPSPGRTTLRVDLDLAAPRIIKVAIPSRDHLTRPLFRPAFEGARSPAPRSEPVTSPSPRRDSSQPRPSQAHRVRPRLPWTTRGPLPAWARRPV